LFMAFSRCGRLSIRVRTPPSRAAMTGVLSMAWQTGTTGPLIASRANRSRRIAARAGLSRRRWPRS
jgi:hypothetical protein